MNTVSFAASTSPISKTIILCALCVYVSITLLEWFVHKYIMHAPDTRHIRHHKSVQPDMLLQEDLFVDDDIKMGTGHSLIITAVSFVLFYVIVVGMFGFRTPLWGIAAAAIGLATFYHLVWNVYHRKMHFEPEFFENKNRYLTWMFQNHAIHHHQKGPTKGNYNILFPGGDAIMGTRRTSVDNEQYCKSAPAKVAICEFISKSLPYVRSSPKQKLGQKTLVK